MDAGFFCIAVTCCYSMHMSNSPLKEALDRLDRAVFLAEAHCEALIRDHRADHADRTIAIRAAIAEVDALIDGLRGSDTSQESLPLPITAHG